MTDDTAGRPPIGPYRVLKVIGSGGQGSVYLGEHIESGAQAALKFYELPLDERKQGTLRRRVAREVSLLRKVEHDAIVRVLDSGEHRVSGHRSPGDLWVAFEYVEGRTVGSMMTLRAPDVESIAGMLQKLASGLGAVHAIGAIHRDIKPDNVILRKRRWDEPVLVDFGYVRPATASRLTTAGLRPGTDGYIPPELRRGLGTATPASDQWSFARVAAELLLWSQGLEIARGQADFEDDVFESLETFASNTAEVFRVALAQDPDERHASIADFAMCLDEALRDDKLFGVDDDTKLSVPRWDRRRPLVSYLSSLGFTFVDKRDRGGILWVIPGTQDFEPVREYLASRDVAFEWAPNGGRSTKNVPGYWTSAAG